MHATVQSNIGDAGCKLTANWNVERVQGTVNQHENKGVVLSCTAAGSTKFERGRVKKVAN